MKNAKKNAAASTQQHLRIAEIRDATVVLKNGGLRAVLKTSSINFNLKSEEEQNAIIYSYQHFLNSLEFPVQIVVRSKKLDLDNYLDNLRKVGEKQTNLLLQRQTFEYVDFISKLIEYADIMEKEFYVIVPYDPGGGKEAPSRFQSFFHRMAPKDTYADIKRRHAQFETYKKDLNQRINTVKVGLENCGLKVDQLDTLQIIELFYNSYNPLTSRNEKLKNVEHLSIETDEEMIKHEEIGQKEAAKAVEKAAKQASEPKKA